MSFFIYSTIIVCALFGAPIFTVMSALALSAFYFSGIELSAVSVEIYRLAGAPTIITIPLFTFAGYVLAESKAPVRLLRLSKAFLGWIPGGTAIVCLFICAFFTAFTGASGVTIIALGGLLYPILIEEGYSEKFTLGLITTCGSLGLLFPPSLPIILYGIIAKVDIDDPKSHLILSAGTHTLDGIEALKYVRTRDFDGRGDIGRMQRQQQFMSSVLKKATSTGVLLNPIKVANFINAAISTIKMDENLSKEDLLNLAKQMRGLSSGNVRTLTVPLSNANGRVEGIGSVVVWDQTLSADLWNRIRDDAALVDKVTPTPSASSTASAKPEIIDKFKTRTAAENPCGEIK